MIKISIPRFIVSGIIKKPRRIRAGEIFKLDESTSLIEISSDAEDLIKLGEFKRPIFTGTGNFVDPLILSMMQDYLKPCGQIFLRSTKDALLYHSGEAIEFSVLITYFDLESQSYAPLNEVFRTDLVPL